MGQLYILIWESKDESKIVELAKAASKTTGINQLFYTIEDEKFRMILEALKEGSR